MLSLISCCGFLDVNKDRLQKPYLFFMWEPIMCGFLIPTERNSWNKSPQVWFFLRKLHNTHKNPPLCFFTSYADDVIFVRKIPGVSIVPGF